MPKSRLQEQWEQAREDLGLALEIPFRLDLHHGATIRAKLLVKNFGAPNGMIIVTDFATLRNYQDEIDRLDYGYSTLDEPQADARFGYDSDTFINLLSDWGWSGPEEKTPSWLKTPESEVE